MKRIATVLSCLALLCSIAFAGIKLNDGDYTFNDTVFNGLNALVANDGHYLEIDYEGGVVSYIWNDVTEAYEPTVGGSITVNRDVGYRYEATDSYGFATFYPQ